MSAVCVFCGSRSGDRPDYAEAARRLGLHLAAHGHTLIYGGGSTGIMGALANAVLEHGGSIVGVIPAHLARPELMHDGVPDMRVTADMHERKALMHLLADVYVILPGGFGTMEELFEAVTWAQLELHSRPIAILNSAGIYNGLLTLMDSMMQAGFLSTACRALVNVFNDAESLLRWIDTCTSTCVDADTGKGSPEIRPAPAS